MKKPILAIIAFLLVAVALIPAYADITSRSWIGATYIGYDNYYRADIIAYKTGSTAVLITTVKNPNATSVTNTINITSVYVTFDWGTTYSSNQLAKPVRLKPQESYVFAINFTVPDTTEASNLYRHTYTIYADYTFKNLSSVNQWLTGKWTWFPTTPDFVVYSTTQADAMDMARIIDGTSPPSGGWRSAKAQILWNKAENETDSGWVYYAEGDFTRAKQRFSTALDHINQAWDAEEAYLTVWEEIDIQESQARIRNLDAITSFFNGLSTMWVLFGIGWVLLGIGYIVKYLRAKRQEAAA